MRKFVLSIIFLGLISCGNKNETVEIPTDFDSNVLVEIMKNPENLSKEKLAKIAGTDAEKIKISKEYFSFDPSKRALLFSWPNGKNKTIKTMKGKELKIDAYSSMGIGFIRKISKEDFQDQFESNEFTQNEINRITSDPSVNADLAIAEAKNLAKNAKNQKFEKLENIGEKAYWETPVNALHVYSDGISFAITTNLTNQKDSKSKAIEILNLILNSKN